MDQETGFNNEAVYFDSELTNAYTLDSIATSLKSIARSLKKLAGPEMETPTEMQRIFAGLAEAVTASELCAHGMREPDCDICQGRSRTT